MAGEERDEGERRTPGRVRLDKWLWAARFWKTRSQAAKAVQGGHVKKGGERLDAAHAVAIGEQLTVTKDGLVWEIVVEKLSDRRGSGADAQALYRETEEGKARRLRQIEDRKAAHALPFASGRPTKRDRRVLERLRRGAGTADD